MLTMMDCFWQIDSQTTVLVQITCFRANVVVVLFHTVTTYNNSNTIKQLSFRFLTQFNSILPLYCCCPLLGKVGISEKNPYLGRLSLKTNNETMDFVQTFPDHSIPRTFERCKPKIPSVATFCGLNREIISNYIGCIIRN